MDQFYTEYQWNEFLQPLVAEISWAKHLVIMAKCKDVQEKQFYILATKKRTIVEYALKDSNQPIGIATYSLSSQLPEPYQNMLPNGEEIVAKLSVLMSE